MRNYIIRFKDVRDKCRFVDRANSVTYDIDLEYGSRSADGKSALGVVANMPEGANIRALFNTNSPNVRMDFDEWIVGD